MSFIGKLKSALSGAPAINEEDVRIEPLQSDKSVPLNGGRSDAGARPAAPQGRGKVEPVTAKVERLEPGAEKGALRYLSPTKEAFMAEVSETVGMMVAMADVIDQNYDLMDDDERRDVVRVVRSLRMFLKHGKSLDATQQQ